LKGNAERQESSLHLLSELETCTAIFLSEAKDGKKKGECKSMNCPKKTMPEKYLSVYKERINALEDALKPLYKEAMGENTLLMTNGRVFSGADEGLGAIGWLYYEGIEDAIDKTVLEQGFVLVLGTLLVNRHGFSWEVVQNEKNDVVFMVSHWMCSFNCVNGLNDS
jgi:hypothetical protein